MKNLLLTGASGFVGRNVLAELQKHYVISSLGCGAGNEISADLAAGVPAALVFVSTTPCREHHSRDKFLLLSRER